jgi:alkanesulfonate monooxygenase SsuD/methylene tetrahydromethanopterin reductase-like flavin-dependent oxidoreductase (luciferase family)
MQYGAHLPLIDLGGGAPTLGALRTYTQTAAALGFDYVCANDHLLFSQPWLDGPTALAAVLDAAGGMTIATTVALPVIRGATQTAKLLGALHHLSDGRLLAGLGPGSSARDYAAAGLPFDERWRRFDESVLALRAELPGLPLWIASWGSPAGLRRVARLGDGWLASAYNTTPEAVRAGRALVDMPNALATTWLHVTESRREAEGMLADVLAPLLNRPVDSLRNLPIGSAEHCAERLAAYAAAGAERIFVWPLTDEPRQLERFRETITRSR